MTDHSAPKTQHTRLALVAVTLWGLAFVVMYFWPARTLLDRMEWRTVDWRFQVRGKLPPSQERQLAIVAVDEESIQRLGRWPWPRKQFAALLEELTRMGAERVIFDVFFTEPDKSAGGGASDAALAEATRRAGNVYHSGFIYVPQSGAPAPVPEGISARAWKHSPVTRGRGLASVATLVEPPAVTFPLPALLEAARGFGVANVLDSGDGIYRHLVPLVRYQGATYPSVALAIGADLLNVPPNQIRVIPGECIELGTQRRIPLDMQGRLLINFVGNPGKAYEYLSAAKVLDHSIPAESVRGKVVLVGVTAPGIYDLRACPYETNFNGVESEANAIDNILTNRFLREATPMYTALLLLGVALLFGVVLPRAPTWLMCLVGAGLLLVYPWLGTWLFARHSLVVDLVHPLGAMLGSFLIVLVMRLLVEERRRHVVQSVLRRFVPPQIVGRLVEEEALTTMRGERRDLSVFFADLRNFTASAEELAPEDTVVFLNRYFALMHEVIWEHEGTLDKYIGDEIMVFFNAPLSQADHARRAVMTAIDMQRRISANQAEWEFLQMPGLSAGIGIATGAAVVGYVGDGERMQYTVIGRTVNLASRLQGLCKQLGCRILINEATYEAVADLVVAEDLGERAIPGIHSPVRVWHVLDYKSSDLRGHWPPVDMPLNGRAEAGVTDTP